MLKGALIGSAAALVVGGGLVAAVMAGRPAPAPAPAGPQMRIVVAPPKEPPAPAKAPKLETVPPGTPDAVVLAAPKASPPVRHSEAVEFSRLEPRWTEPERDQGDFIDEGEPPFLDQPEIASDSARRRHWRERRFEARRADIYPPPEAYDWDYPPPPRWRR